MPTEGIKKRNLEMVQKIINEIYSPLTIPLPRKLRKVLKKDRKRKR